MGVSGTFMALLLLAIFCGVDSTFVLAFVVGSVYC